jgi:hypothetical protein
MVVITKLMAWTWHHVFNGSPMCKEVKPDIIFPGAEGRHHRWWFLPKEIRPGSFPSSQRRPRQDPPSSEGTWGPTLSRSRYPGFPRSDMLLLHPRLAHLLHPLTPHVRSTIRSMRGQDTAVFRRRERVLRLPHQRRLLNTMRWRQGLPQAREASSLLTASHITAS